MARERSSGRWQGDFTFAGKRYREDGFETRAEAESWEALGRASLLVGKPLPKRNNSDSATVTVTLKSAYEKTWAKTWSSSRSSKTSRHNIETALEYFGPACDLADIGESRIDDYIVHLKGTGLSDGTINRKLAALSKVMRDAYRRTELKRMPVFERQQESEGRHRQLSVSEEAVLLATSRQWGWKDEADAYAVLIDTGLRTGELFSLTDTDVNLKGGSLTIRGANAKSKKARGVPLTDRAKGILKARIGGGKPFGCFTEGSFRHKWDRLKGHMKLTEDAGFVPHALRHTCASRLVQAGVELLVVKEWLGHSSIQVTMRYAHLAPKNLSAARDILNRLNLEHAAEAAE